MKSSFGALVLMCAAFLLSGCEDRRTTGKVCMGEDNLTLVESMGNTCAAGDAIATRFPAHYCDFNYAVTHDIYNSAFCIYSGKRKESRMPLHEK